MTEDRRREYVPPIEYVTLSCGMCSAVLPVTQCGPGNQLASCWSCGTIFKVTILAGVFNQQDVTWN